MSKTKTAQAALRKANAESIEVDGWKVSFDDHLGDSFEIWSAHGDYVYAIDFPDGVQGVGTARRNKTVGIEFYFDPEHLPANVKAIVDALAAEARQVIADS